MGNPRSGRHRLAITKFLIDKIKLGGKVEFCEDAISRSCVRNACKSAAIPVKIIQKLDENLQIVENSQGFCVWIASRKI